MVLPEARSDLVKGTFVPILLQEFLLALGFLLPQFMSSFQIFPQSLFLGHSPPSLNLLPFFLLTNLLLFLLFDASQFSEPPSLEFCSWVQAVGIVNVGNKLFLLL
jgi:hypothetical protein